MVRERAGEHRARRAPLRVVKGVTEMPILDLVDGIRLYLNLQEQGRRLDASIEEIRGRILRAMASAGLDELAVDDVEAVRQVRHFAPQIDLDHAERLLRREGRLHEAERRALDAEKARKVLDELYVQGRVTEDELPYTEAREVEALIVRENPESRFQNPE